MLYKNVYSCSDLPKIWFHWKGSSRSPKRVFLKSFLVLLYLMIIFIWIYHVKTKPVVYLAFQKRVLIVVNFRKNDLVSHLTIATTILPKQKQPSRCVLLRKYFQNFHQIYCKSPMPKCDFNKVALQQNTFLWEPLCSAEWSNENNANAARCFNVNLKFSSSPNVKMMILWIYSVG